MLPKLRVETSTLCSRGLEGGPHHLSEGWKVAYTITLVGTLKLTTLRVRYVFAENPVTGYYFML